MNITFYIGLTTKDGLVITDFLSTEEIKKFFVQTLAAYGIDGFNMVEGTGFWKGTEEKCLNVSVDGIADRANAEAIAADFAKGFDQDCVAWLEFAPLSFTGSANSTAESIVPAPKKTYRIQSWSERDGCWMEDTTTCVYTNNAFKFGAANALENEAFDYRGTTYRLVNSELPSLKGEFRVESALDGTIDYGYNGYSSLARLTNHKNREVANKAKWEKLSLLNYYSLADLCSQ